MKKNEMKKKEKWKQMKKKCIYCSDADVLQVTPLLIEGKVT